MQIVIDIPDSLNENILICWENIHPKVWKILKDGTVLPKGHGRLIDADAFERRCMFDSDIEDMQDVIYALRDYKTIIEADKEVDL